MTDYTPLCGWIEPQNRNIDEKSADKIAKAGMPSFAMSGEIASAPEKVILTDFWKSKEVQDAIGFIYPGTWQKTGSCVGAGGGNVLFSTAATEVIVAGELERIIVPQWLLPYGKSRQRCGMRGRGDGSLGSTFAAACGEDGFLDGMDEDAPKFQRDQYGLIWGSQTELEWSDGAAIPQKYLTKAKPFTVGVRSIMKTSADVKLALSNYYAVAIAVSHFCSPERSRLVGSGPEAVVIGDFDSRGGHQTSLQGYWDHPTLGLIFLYVNQWGGVYPLDPLTGMKSVCWIKASAVDWACQQDEVIAYSGLSGFKARTYRSVF